MAGIDLGDAWADGVWEEGVWAAGVWADGASPPATLLPCASVGGSLLASVAGTSGSFPTGDGSNTEHSFSFMSDAVVPWTVTGLCVDLWKLGVPTGDITAKLWATDGAGLPTGSALRTSIATLDIEELGLTWFNRIAAGFTFAELELALNTRYAFSIAFPTGDASNYLSVHVDVAGSDPGIAGELSGTWAVVPGHDVAFQLKGIQASVGGDAVEMKRLMRRRRSRRGLFGR